MMEKPTLIIGDCHGHFDRLDALLQQEGIINDKGDRINHDVTVVQLGDLGHFGSTPVYLSDGKTLAKWVPASPTGDLLCYKAVYDENWIDIVLWGNHDRAVVDSWHAFGGYVGPPAETLHIMKLLVHQDRLRLAYACHDFLITHAGLVAAFKFQKEVPNSVKEDPYEFANFINYKSKQEIPGSIHAVWDAIGAHRGGNANAGGILWRDQTEKLYKEFNQVYGHSTSSKHKPVKTEIGDKVMYNIDIGGKNNKPGDDGNCLCGIWLPSQELVRIDL